VRQVNEGAAWRRVETSIGEKSLLHSLTWVRGRPGESDSSGSNAVARVPDRSPATKNRLAIPLATKQVQ
jgi:hypothetical protein